MTYTQEQRSFLLLATKLDRIALALESISTTLESFQPTERSSRTRIDLGLVDLDDKDGSTRDNGFNMGIL